MGRSALARQDAAEPGERHGTGAIRPHNPEVDRSGRQDARAKSVPPGAAFQTGA